MRARPDGRELPRPVAVLALAAAALVYGCDDIVKHIDVFTTMTDGPAIETYEEKPVPPPEGAVPATGELPDLPLPAADTASVLQNPLSGTEAQLERGQVLYRDFCLPCHGPQGRGRGPVVNHDGERNAANNNRMPFIPAIDLTSGTGPQRSDGYIWGIIHNGRGLMPEYRRVDREDRWYVIEYVRHLQREAGAEPTRGVAGPGATEAGGGEAAGAGG